MFTMKVQPEGTLGFLSDAEKKQLPFAASLALNRTANKGQQAEQNRIKGYFKLRREAFILQGIKIDKQDRATKSSWSVVIRVQVDRDFLNRMEDGGLKIPTKGRWLWKPNEAVFGDKIIARSNPLHPSNLKFTGNAHRGPNGTFMVNGNGKSNGPLVLQRVEAGARGISQSIARGGLRGPKGRDAAGKFTKGEAIKGVRRGGVRLLYTLVSRTRVPRKLEFVETITSAASAAWPSEMKRAMAEAMSTSK